VDLAQTSYDMAHNKLGIIFTYNILLAGLCCYILYLVMVGALVVTISMKAKRDHVGDGDALSPTKLLLSKYFAQSNNRNLK